MALNVFESFGMIEIIDNVFYLSAWEKYQNTDGLEKIREQNRKRKQVQRAKEKAQLLIGETPMSRDSHVTVTQCHATEEEIEREEEKEEEFHSFTLSARKEAALEKLGGKLGKGVVMLSEEQMDDLLEKLSLDEFDKYVSIVADCELSGKRYTTKSHYKAILDMAAKDRKLA